MERSDHFWYIHLTRNSRANGLSMTELLDDRPHTAGGVRILIIGVGCFDGGRLSPIPGVRDTVARLADWWMNADKRLLGGATVTSVDVLLSAEAGDVSLKGKSGRAIAVERARHVGVKAAMRRWCRESTGPLAVLHWVGHGAIVGQAHPMLLQALYCEDQADDEGTHQAGFEWGMVCRGIDAESKAGRVVCFVDTCRTVLNPPDGEDYQSPFDSHRRQRHRTLVYYATEVGEATYAIGKGSALAAEFDGGTFMSEAARMALDRFGAVTKDSEIGPAAYPSHVLEAMQCRIKRWRGRVKTPEGGMPKIARDSYVGEEEPIVRVPQPMSMVDLRLRAPYRYDAASCRLVSGTSHNAPHKGKSYWEADLEHGDWEAHVDFNGWWPGRRLPSLKGCCFSVNLPHKIQTIPPTGARKEVGS